MGGYESPWMTDELKLLRETARGFFVREGLPNVARWEQQKGVDRDFWLKAGDLGLLCPTVPEEYGGSGGNILHHIVITEEQARTIDKGWGNGVHSGVVADYLLSYGSDLQKKRWLPGMVSGSTIAAIAMTEPSAGSDVQAIRTTAVRDGDEYVINGSKTFITNGGSADLILVAVKTDPAARGKGISLIVVETAGCPGFERGRVLEKIGQHAADTSELSFTDVRVPVTNRLGDEGAGFKMLMQQLPQERLFIGVGAVVPIELAVERTVEYAKDRELFGGPLYDLQNTRFELAECATIARIARTFIDHCIALHLAGELDSATSSMAKLWLTDMQFQVVDRCLQLFGGYGYMKEYPIARMFTDARVQRIYGGSNEVMKEVIARSL